MGVIPLKNGPCAAGCGIIIQYRTTPKVLCPDCRTARKAEQSRLGMERQRRKRGIPAVKGTEKDCERCGVKITLNRNAAAKFCAACRDEASRERAAARSKRLSKTPEGREKINAWQRQKTAKDPSFRLSAHMRVLMHRSLKASKAGRSWRKLVPYSLDELMRHLERQFLPGMTWENKGEWHVDHIRPLSSFEMTGSGCAEFKAAWALSNLRPLWGPDNIRKNARITHLL